MDHDWYKMPDPLPGVPDLFNTKSSDVWVCRRCHQLTITEIGSHPEAGAYNVKDCNESIVETVLES